VVDAGYYDNYGIQVAGAWVYKHRDWLLKNTSGVVLIQIRDFLGQRSRLNIAREGTSGSWDFLGRSVQFFCSPVEALLEARYSSSSFRNDGVISILSDFFDKGMFDMSKLVPPCSVISILSDFFDKGRDRLGFFTTVAFENSQDVALSWAITQGELARLRRSITRKDVERDFKKTFGREATPQNVDAQIEAIESRVKTLGDVTPKEGEEDPIRRAERLINYRRVHTLMDWWFH